MKNPSQQTDYLASTVILRATRSWVRALEPMASQQNRDCHVAIWNESFAIIGNADARIIWGNFMQHLSQEAVGPFLLGCRGCGRVSEDESALLDCIAGHQNNKYALVEKSLKRWFRCRAYFKAEAITESFADQLKINGFTLETINQNQKMYDLVGSNTTPLNAQLLQ